MESTAKILEFASFIILVVVIGLILASASPRRDWIYKSLEMMDKIFKKGVQRTHTILTRIFLAIALVLGVVAFVITL